MLTTKQMEKYAAVLMWALNTARQTKLKKNESVLIRFDQPAVPLAEIVFRKLMQQGLNPIPRMTSTPAMDRAFFEMGTHRQLTFQTPGDKQLHQQINGSIYLYAPASLTHLSGIDPKRIGKTAVARKPLRDILDRREEKGDFSWTLCMWPTEALAKHAGITLKQYTQQIIKACWLNSPSPVREWQKVYLQISAIKQWLNDLPIKTLHVESDHIDLTITPGKQRRWIGLSGHNIPSFEIFTSPDWRGTSGFYYADQPSYRTGNRVEGARFEFKKGRAVKISARKGGAFLKKQLAMDVGANRIGEFSLTDKRFSKITRFMANTLYDENFGGRYGNCHLAFGSSYSNAYRGNPSRLTRARRQQLGFNDSALHWDLVNTEKKRVTAHLQSGQRRTIYENGIFKL